MGPRERRTTVIDRLTKKAANALIPLLKERGTAPADDAP
ncbi:hypothetical protein H4W79_002499 [Nocardiopsis terrae]|uniref:Transposase n=1 Tax=Nocardiopsis terrae TaxID=372655 RepID=A0ABR9HGY5_9ACTN|nr:hypothetical protein [Nocardiopsis terrae]